MNWFPQTVNGSLVQFPFTRRRAWRVVLNEMESGERVSMADAAAGLVEWKLRYTDVSDSELASLTQLHADSGGGQRSFAFIDPTANLLAWSEDPGRPDWESSGLTISGGANDPLNGHRATSISNGTAADLKLQQTVPLPGSMTCCFSVWVQSASSVSIGLGRDEQSLSYTVSNGWKRIEFAGLGNEGAIHSTFVLTVPAGLSVNVFGFQVECQPSPSKYRPARASRGIYRETWFTGDELVVSCDGPGRSSCNISLISRVS